MLTGLDPALNSHSHFLFSKSLPQEGAIFLFKPQLVKSLTQNWVTGIQILLEIHHVPEEQEMMDVSPEKVSLHAHTLNTEVKPSRLG